MPVLRLVAPNPVFPSLLATPQASILKGGGLDGDPNVDDLGTGPFLLKGGWPRRPWCCTARSIGCG